MAFQVLTTTAVRSQYEEWLGMVASFIVLESFNPKPQNPNPKPHSKLSAQPLSPEPKMPLTMPKA